VRVCVFSGLKIKNKNVKKSLAASLRGRSVTNLF